MSKAKAVTYAAVAAGFTLLILFFFPSAAFGCAFPFGLAALIFCAIAYAKHRRDVQIIRDAEWQRQHSRRVLPPPAMSSKGSSRLFIPPPLDRH